MKELQKKILVELLATPFTMLTGMAGVSLLLLAVVMGSGWALAGIALCLASVGLAVTNAVMNYEAVAKRVIERVRQEGEDEKNAKLDELDRRLSSDRDPRDQEALRNLRGLYDSFMEDVRLGKVSVVAGRAMLAQIEEIFARCVEQLEKQYEVWQTSRKVAGDLRGRLLKQKSDILDDVEGSVRALAEVTNEVRCLGLKVGRGELTKLQERLKGQLAAAKATEELVTQAEVGADLSRFAEYQK